jgi:hypothetical protein
MADPIRWGLATTIKAPVADILSYAAYHIELGAHRLYLYLDEPNPEAEPILKAHPKVRVITCDASWWNKRFSKRPEKHQVRQAMNATHAYNRRQEVDWLIHMDVDEYLVASTPLARQLAQLPDDAMTARARPAELLADGDETAFKTWFPIGPDRAQMMARLYPTFGPHLKTGFLSHMAGKSFVRTGADKVQVRIHNAYFAGEENPGEVALPQTTLCHLHATSWDQWRAHFLYRLEKGSYRADLNASKASEFGPTLHELLSLLYEEDGEKGLRAFFDEVCADTPELRARLDTEGLLTVHDLDLKQALRRVFPDWRDQRDTA